MDVWTRGIRCKECKGIMVLREDEMNVPLAVRAGCV